jgi:diguanylate cyclase (GGDEF)-like protein
MPRKSLQPVHLYCIGIAALGAVLFSGLLSLTSVGLERFGTSAFWALAVSVLVGELLPLEIPRVSGDGEVTISTMFSFALLLTAGLVPAITAQAIASAVQDAVARKPIWRIAFNMGQYALTLAAAAFAIGLIVGHAPPLGSRFGALELAAVIAAAGAFFAVNLVLVTRATSLYEGTPLLSALRSDLVFSLSVGMVLLCLAPIVVTVLDFSPALFPLFFIPVFGIYSSGRQAARTAKAEHEATHDSLTGLPNRRWFREAVDRALAEPDVGRAAVMLVDLNRFKDVNDTLGHHHGDLVLREVGPRLRSCFRQQDFVARLGGDEFALFMRDLSEPAAEAAVERLQEALQAPFEADGISIELDASAGIAWFPDHGSDVDTLLQRADVAMYRAKGTHRSLVTYRPEDDHHSHARLALVSDLRRALLDHRLLLHYQPQIDVRSGIPVGAEGLVRWNHPERGLLEPAEFIEVAEQTGVIKDLTYHVINLGLRDLGHWLYAGRDLSLSLNIPGPCLLDRNFPLEVERLLRMHGVDGGSLIFELTESSLLVDPVLAKATMQDLSRLGISLAIDDFGTGYSSLAYITDMPIREMKIDKSFVLGMNSDPRNAVIVKSTIELARNLKIRTVAEGIEDAETLERMLELGCDLAQGFHLSRGLATEEFVGWWDARVDPLTAITAPRPSLALVSSDPTIASAA